MKKIHKIKNSKHLPAMCMYDYTKCLSLQVIFPTLTTPETED